MMQRMLPGVTINKVSLHEGISSLTSYACYACYACYVCYVSPLYWSWPVAELDGDQTLDLYWIDPVEAMDRFVGRPQFKDKIYYQYERQESVQRPSKRAFSRANSGLVFQEAQALDMFSVPMLHLFYSDKSFSGQHGGRYPVSRKFWFRISYKGLL